MKLNLGLLCLYFLFTLNGISEPLQQQLEKLNSEVFEVRKQAQEDIKKAILADKASLEYFMFKLLHSYTHSPHPEVKLRLLQLMQNLSEDYKKSLGRTAVGIRFKGSFQTIDNVRKETVKISSVKKDSPADIAGLLKGDEIISFQNVTFAELHHTAHDRLDELLDEYTPGEEVTLTILRAKQTFDLKLTLGSTLKKKPALSKEKEEELSQLITTMDKSAKLHPSYDNGSFFSRWFKNQLEQ